MLELIKEKEKEILKVSQEAYKEALNHLGMLYIVEIDSNGSVYYWNTTSGSNAHHTGDVMELFSFCFKEIEVSEDDLAQKLMERCGDRYAEMKCLAGENYGTSLETLIIDSDDQELKNILEECKKEKIEFMIDEYAYFDSEEKLYNLIDVLESAI